MVNLNDMEPDVRGFFEDLGLKSDEEISEVVEVTMDAFDIAGSDILFEEMSDAIDEENLESEDYSSDILNFIRQAAGE
mgnify:CR=1 FL=1